MTEESNIYVVEAVELSSDSDTQQLLEDVLPMSDPTGADDLDDLMLSMRGTTHHPVQESEVRVEAGHVHRLQVVDDFIRNFLTTNHLTKTLSAFQREWYEYVHTQNVPDAYLQNEVLRDEIQQLSNKLNEAVVLSDRAKSMYDKLLKERDFHKMHHERVQKDKKKLTQNIERLSQLQTQYTKKYDELVEKYNYTMKEKMLLKIERDRLKAQTTPKRQQQLPNIEMSGTKTKYTPLPADEQPIYRQQQTSYKQTVLSKTQKGHNAGVCSVVFHHKKSILGTGGDDMVWKIWTVGQSQQIMVGQGHKDWVSCMRFHPKGLHMVTGSGDSTVKIWDFNTKTCSYTFTDHRQPVWTIDLNRTGDYIATGSSDHSARLLDINVGKCRTVLRGHVDAVHSVHFQPHTNLLATASADKTLSIWDMRTALCVQTYYGHELSLNGCRFNPKGDRVHSCDAKGVVKTWDLKNNQMIRQYECESALCLSVDRTGGVLAVGTAEGNIYLFNDGTGEKENVLKGHQGKVQAVEFDGNSKMIASGGSDCTYRIWQ